MRRAGVGTPFNEDGGSIPTTLQTFTCSHFIYSPPDIRFLAMILFKKESLYSVCSFPVDFSPPKSPGVHVHETSSDERPYTSLLHLNGSLLHALLYTDLHIVTKSPPGDFPPGYFLHKPQAVISVSADERTLNEEDTDCASECTTLSSLLSFVSDVKVSEGIDQSLPKYRICDYLFGVGAQFESDIRT